MTDQKIVPVKSINGKVIAPPSKAHTLRAIIIASLAKGKTTIKNALIAEDQEYAIKAMQQFGAQIQTKNGLIEIIGVNGKPTAPKEDVFIGNSGLAVRFLVSVAGLAQGQEYVTLDGVERMRTGRPIQDLLDALSPLGVEAVSINGNGCPPIRVKCDSFTGGKTQLAGEKSSQYFSSILVAAPYAKKDVEIKSIGHLSSRLYTDVTIESMKAFGVETTNSNYALFKVKAGQHYEGKDITIEGDFSNAAYFFVAAAITKGKVTVEKLTKKTIQGDVYILELLERMGCKVTWNKDAVTVEGADLKGLGEVDMNTYPDIVMPVAIAAAFARGTTRITNVAHLKFKESDRLASTTGELKNLGANISHDDDSITIIGEAGGTNLHGATIDSHNDHRIAMSFTIAGLKIPGVIIHGKEAVNKSFPEFFEEIEKIIQR